MHSNLRLLQVLRFGRKPALKNIHWATPSARFIALTAYPSPRNTTATPALPRIGCLSLASGRTGQVLNNSARTAETDRNVDPRPRIRRNPSPDAFQSSSKRRIRSSRLRAARTIEEMKNRTLLQLRRSGKHDFLRGMASIFGGVWGDGRSFAPPRYPRDAQQQDVVRIGRDMHRATCMVRREVLSTKSNGTKPRSEPSAGAGNSWPPTEAPKRLPQNSRKSVAGSDGFTESIPSPAMLAEYEKILPGGTERIVRMAENERNHRQDWETACISGHAAEIMRSQWMCLSIVIASMFSATFLAMSGKVAAACIFGAVGILWTIAGILSTQGKRTASKA